MSYLGRIGQAAILALAGVTASCGVRAPAPLDVADLVRTHGPAGARGELEVRVIDDPRDVQARLALAKLADEAKRPSQAIEQLDAVLGLGGPIGTRWHDDDRARFARLLAARGRARLARGTQTAHGDLERARSFGAAITDEELARARAFAALADLRHIDAELRERGRRVLAELAIKDFADRSWLGARLDALPRNRGLWGIWLWEQGARRAAWEALGDWLSTMTVREREIHEAYLRAYAWWTPYDGPPPPERELVGPARCRFAPATGCEPSVLLGGGDDTALAALATAPVARTTNPDHAAAWAAITLPRALRGETSWGGELAGHVDIAALDRTQLPLYARPVFAHLAGAGTISIDDGAVAAMRPAERLVVAASRALDGGAPSTVRTALGDLAVTADGLAVLAIVEPVRASAPAAPFAEAVDGFLRARGAAAVQLAPIVDGYARDPGIADRLARDAVHEAVDAAAAHAAIGALFSLVGDPARARTSWQAAVDRSAEPAYLRGLAEAIARAGDPDAALVHGTTAAAASGDPAVVWIELSRALDDAGEHVHALEAARYAVDLAGADTIADALDAAIASSRALRRDAQATELLVRRSRVAPAFAPGLRDHDPTDAAAAVTAFAPPSEPGIARLWAASRWNPREVAVRALLVTALPVADPRHTVVVRELVLLAGDPDATIGRAAVAALAGAGLRR